MSTKVKLKVGDQVRVISGRSKGRDGRILRIDPKNMKVWVEGVNIVKKTVKPTSQNQKGGITDVEGCINLSNVMILSKNGVTRLRIQGNQKEKLRICTKSGEQV